MNKVDMWICPHCKEILQEKGNSFRCEHGHHYDTAKEGYVNLLLANKKNSKEPGDSAEMISARSSFLGTGHYTFLLNHIISLARELCASSRRSNIIDLGCGDGFYLRGLNKYLGEHTRYWGIDISKPAARVAAGKFREARFAVASCFDIPVLTDSMDIALSIFSPFGSDEIARILRPGGSMFRVRPGPRHLMQLKERLFLNAAAHSQPKPIATAKTLSEETIAINVTLNIQELRDLLHMTPLKWRGNTEAKKALLQGSPLNLDFEFVVQRLKF